MKSNPAVNRESTIATVKKFNPFGNSVVIEGEFIRNGNIGQWKSSMSNEMIKKFDEWTQQNLKNCDGLTF